MKTTGKADTEKAAAEAPRVEFSSEVLRQIRQHARTSMNAEICGVLLGAAQDGVTRVTARIEGVGAVEAGTNVTFTQETWAHIFRVKDADYPELSIVGWYHSHPGFGVFLSDYDIFIHENFFSGTHQLAWVFDPHSDEEGCFGWVGGGVKPLSGVSIRQNLRGQSDDAGEGARGASLVRIGREEVEGAPLKRSYFTAVLVCATLVVVSLAVGAFLRPYLDKLSPRALSWLRRQPVPPAGSTAPSGPAHRPGIPIVIPAIPASTAVDAPMPSPSPEAGMPAPSPTAAEPQPSPVPQASPPRHHGDDKPGK